MRLRISLPAFIVALFLCIGARSLSAQQKPQWLPGQMGLNSGIMPSPGFTYVNITVNYSASAFNNPSGSPVPVTGSYDVWAVEDIFYFVPGQKLLGATVGGMFMFPTPATGSLAADITNTNFPNLSATAGGAGLADLWIQPIGLGWHLKRADLQIMEGVLIPTGRYSPGASNNVGFGYVGNHLTTGSTLYITKNKGTSANLFTDWEVHGQRAGTNNTYKTPGQAFTDEWGLGQILPLKKNMTQLLQLGAIGYDQWQITDNGGTIPVGPFTAPASLLPHYSVHAAGGQIGYIAPLKNLTLNFKYEHEYQAYSHTLGNTLVFGGTWTWLHPKPARP
jgi:hypothetical protein